MEVPACGTKNQDLLHGSPSWEPGFLLRLVSLAYADGCTADHN
jgi:hypothetical protein